MSTRSLQSLSPDQTRHVLETDPRALLVKSDSGSTSFFTSGVKKYLVGATDMWSTEEPCSKSRAEVPLGFPKVGRVRRGGA